MTVFKSMLGGAVALALGTMAQAEELKLAHFCFAQVSFAQCICLCRWASSFPKPPAAPQPFGCILAASLGAGPVKQYDRVDRWRGRYRLRAARLHRVAIQDKRCLLELPGVVTPGTNKTEAIWSQY